MKTTCSVIAAALLVACNTAPQPATPEAPKTIGYTTYNATATEHLQTQLSKTATVKIILGNVTHTLTATETRELLALLDGAKSSAPQCPPADCMYLNLHAANGEWLMSLPAQSTTEGIVLLYLQLQGNNAGAPLQCWWQGVTNRLNL